MPDKKKCNTCEFVKNARIGKICPFSSNTVVGSNSACLIRCALDELMAKVKSKKVVECFKETTKGQAGRFLSGLRTGHVSSDDLMTKKEYKEHRERCEAIAIEKGCNECGYLGCPGMDKCKWKAGKHPKFPEVDLDRPGF